MSEDRPQYGTPPPPRMNVSVDTNNIGSIMRVAQFDGITMYLDRDEAFELLRLMQEHIGEMPVSVEPTTTKCETHPSCETFDDNGCRACLLDWPPDAPTCPTCGDSEAMIKHDDGKWHCRRTHRTDEPNTNLSGVASASARKTGSADTGENHV